MNYLKKTLVAIYHSPFLFQATCDYNVKRTSVLFNLLSMTVNHEILNEPQLKELLGEIKSVQRLLIKNITEINRKSKNKTELSSPSSEPSNKPIELNDEEMKNAQKHFDFHRNIWEETLTFLESTCETTSGQLCIHSKGKYRL